MGARADRLHPAGGAGLTALEPPVAVAVEEGGSLLRLTLDRPKGNILDLAMIRALRAAFQGCRERSDLRAVLLTGAGRHFSFGASVEEHQPGQVEEMLPEFHGLFRDLLDCEKVVLAAVRGQCLGGGLELAAACHRVFAGPDARLGQPEVKLGVFAPVASLLLPLRCGQGRADDLLLTGRTVVAEQALAMGLVDELAGDPEERAVAWHREHLRPLSAAALGCAVRAARHHVRRVLVEELPLLEHLFLDELMQTADAREGIASFLERRRPSWTHA